MHHGLLIQPFKTHNNKRKKRRREEQWHCCNFLFPPALLTNAASFVSFTSLAISGISEIRGKNMQYSKFSGIGTSQNAASSSTAESKIKKLPSRLAMATLYTPAFLAGVSSFVIFPDEEFRFLLLKFAITTHFFKRVFESLFLHKYSGEMALGRMMVILSSYFTSSPLMIYFQHLTVGIPEPSIDLKYTGVVLFSIGIIGNFFHHFLLSKLRSNGSKEYKIPKGGLFEFVICPHYLFEVMVFWSFGFISQTLYSFAFALGTTFYLMGRSYATRNWYLGKFEDFPEGVKAFFPFVF